MKRFWLLAGVWALALLVFPTSVRTQWETPNRAFHKATGFPLDGRHQTVPCQACHVNGVFKGTPTTCFSCHWIRRQDDRYKTRLGAQCEACHTTTSWLPARWNHAAQAGVALSPQHLTLACDTCHRDGNFSTPGVDCASCHMRDYQATTQPNHAAAGFPTACETCHRPSDVSFQQATFNHNQYFPLVGAHATQACATCHRNSVYKGTPTDCVGCHRADYDRTTSPNHASAGFPTACDSCHKASDPSWASGGGFNHSSVFALVGVHATVACATCHKNNVFKGTPTACVGCHQADYNKTTSPNHASAGFPTACDSCHKASDPSWASGGGFNHNGFFALVGVHATVACAVCHKNNVFKGTPTACVGCHQADYNKTTNPNHAAAGFPTTCDSCHKASDASWDQGRFVHSWFPITSGHHAGRPCSACHTNPSSYAVFTCTTCHGRSDTDSHHHGVNGYRYDSAACYACHPNGRGD